MLTLTVSESHAVLIGWVRYCLGRRSYAVGECTDFLIARWADIPPKTQAIILQDIKGELVEPSGGGMAMDRESWNAVITKCKILS